MILEDGASLSCCADAGQSEPAQGPAKQLSALLNLLVAAAKVPSSGLASALGGVTGKWIQYAVLPDVEPAREPDVLQMTLGDKLASCWCCIALPLSRHVRPGDLLCFMYCL